ncbi:unnamed protein product [Pleuronectes platessa]|uniref:Uncharacterized protein n=1 Tax=Pleuronectes platessa TaxID=8262 RepID=A0A9N7UID2_PLEPL|nr:unnamed protein product [Pleuronectes platessa]
MWSGASRPLQNPAGDSSTGFSGAGGRAHDVSIMCLKPEGENISGFDATHEEDSDEEESSCTQTKMEPLLGAPQFVPFLRLQPAGSRLSLGQIPSSFSGTFIDVTLKMPGASLVTDFSQWTDNLSRLLLLLGSESSCALLSGDVVMCCVAGSLNVERAHQTLSRAAAAADGTACRGGPEVFDLQRSPSPSLARLLSGSLYSSRQASRQRSACSRLLNAAEEEEEEEVSASAAAAVWGGVKPGPVACVGDGLHGQSRRHSQICCEEEEEKRKRRRRGGEERERRRKERGEEEEERRRSRHGLHEGICFSPQDIMTVFDSSNTPGLHGGFNKGTASSKGQSVCPEQEGREGWTEDRSSWPRLQGTTQKLAPPLWAVDHPSFSSLLLRVETPGSRCSFSAVTDHFMPETTANSRLPFPPPECVGAPIGPGIAQPPPTQLILYLDVSWSRPQSAAAENCIFTLRVTRSCQNTSDSRSTLTSHHGLLIQEHEICVTCEDVQLQCAVHVYVSPSISFSLSVTNKLSCVEKPPSSREAQRWPHSSVSMQPDSWSSNLL